MWKLSQKEVKVRRPHLRKAVAFATYRKGNARGSQRRAGVGMGLSPATRNVTFGS